MNYWQKHNTTTPAYPEMLWAQPENRQLAGKLTVIGGSLHGFSAPAEAYQSAQKAGIGRAQVLLPSALKRTVAPLVPDAEFAPSNPSGSFSQQALTEALTLSSWADGTLLAGDFSRNSETAIMLEKLTQKSAQQLTITQDALDYFIHNPKLIFLRDKTTLVMTFAQIQKLATALRFTQAFKLNLDLINLVELLHDFTAKYSAAVIIDHHKSLIVGYRGQISSIKTPAKPANWQVKTAAYAAVWQLQNPDKTLEALTIAIQQSQAHY